MEIYQHNAAGIVVFRIDPSGERVYLLIRHSAGHWEFPKGHMEAVETWRDTAIRELREETGIASPQLIPGFARQIQYVYRDRKKRLIHKTDRFALARIETDQIRLSSEHLDFAFLDYQSALIRLTHAGTRALLRDVNAFLADGKTDARTGGSV